MDRRAPSHEIRAPCPFCGVDRVAASGLSTANPPADGDVMICGDCHGVGVFVAGPLGLAIRAPAPAEWPELIGDARVRAALGALAESYDSWDAADLAYRGGADG